MGKQFNRKEVLARLNKCIREKKPILAVCAGSGLNAKAAEIGGADLITLVHTGYVRQKGLPSIAKLDISPGEIVRELICDEFASTKDIPIICGIDVSEISVADDLNALIDRFIPKGFSGIMNYPTSGDAFSEDFVALVERSASDKDYQKIQHAGEMAMLEEAREKEASGVGYGRELELVRLCRKRGILTVVYAFSAEQAQKMAEAGADCISAHCGGTAGGLVGHDTTLSYTEAASRLQILFDAARSVNPKIILLGHGGPFAEPEDTKVMYELTNAQGFIAGSAIDRIPIERGIIGTTQRFKNIKL